MSSGKRTFEEHLNNSKQNSVFPNNNIEKNNNTTYNGVLNSIHG